MLVLRCTRQLLTRLHHEDATGAKSTTRLGDWYGNVLRRGRRQHLLFISERSRLPLLPVCGAKHLVHAFPDAVCAVLAAVGVSAADIADERARMVTIGLGRTRSRSLLGTLNDFAFMAQHGKSTGEGTESSDELIRFLSRTPIIALGGANPIELTQAAFEDRGC